jgi:chromosome segregation ATPase
MQESNNTLKKHHKELYKKVSLLEKEKEHLLKEVDNGKSSRMELENTIANQKQSIENLNSEFETINADFLKLKAEKENSKKYFEDLQKQNKSLERSYKSSIEEIQTKTTEVGIIDAVSKGKPDSYGYH